MVTGAMTDDEYLDCFEYAMAPDVPLPIVTGWRAQAVRDFVRAFSRIGPVYAYRQDVGSVHAPPLDVVKIEYLNG